MPPSSPFAEPHPTAGPLAEQRRGLVLTLRIVSVVLGIAAALVALFCAGLVAVFGTCDAPEVGGLCRSVPALVPVLEWAIALVAFGAPLAGGIASCRRREWAWLPAGAAIAVVMVVLMLAVSTGQASTLS